MRLFVYALIFVFLCSLTYATKIETSDFIIYYHEGASSMRVNTTEFNGSSGSGQSMIGNYTNANLIPRIGIFYIHNITFNDTTPPILTIYSPTTTTYTTNSILVNFTATDNTGLDTLWYYNGTGNTTSSSQTITLPDGTYNFTFYANDTNGNIVSSYIAFTVSVSAAIPPEEGAGVRGTTFPVNPDGTLAVPTNPDGSANMSILYRCEQKTTLLQRLKDNCSYANGICEDGENPIMQKEDCKISSDAVSCKNGRCMFKEIWFAKVIIILILFLFLFYKKDYQLIIVILLGIILFNFSSIAASGLIKDDISKLMQGIPTQATEESRDLSSYMCTRQAGFIDRLKDDCIIENGICEDGENPMYNKDCELSIGSLGCNSDRCIYQEGWLAKLALLALLMFILFYKKDYNLFILIISLLILFNFATTPYSAMIKDDINSILYNTNITPEAAAKQTELSPYKCIQSQSFIDRLKDDCIIENGICEDGEGPLSNEDCQISADSITCKNGRCIYKEIWFAKLLLILLFFFILFYKPDYRLLIGILLVLLALNFSTTQYASLIRADAGSIVAPTFPNTPMMGIAILLFIAYFAFKILPRRRR